MHEELKALGFKDASYLMNTGIYALCLRGKVIYIGHTTNLFNRLADDDHRHREFDKIYFIKCDPHEIDRLEALMILRFKPEEGKAFNYNKNTDPAHKPPAGVGNEATHIISVGGVQLSLKGRRRV